jgi:hypothetical protein
MLLYVSTSYCQDAVVLAFGFWSLAALALRRVSSRYCEYLSHKQ